VPATADIPRVVEAVLTPHPAIQGVELAGSRARGEAVELSDWDLAVEYGSFDDVAGALPDLVEPLDPLARQWDRLSPFPTYMLMLRGPVKVDLLFPREPAPRAKPWTASPETLPAIDDHFWDWALWLASKRQAGRLDLVSEELGKLHGFLLVPMGSKRRPGSFAAAVDEYVERREGLERRFGVQVRRELEREVRPALGR